MDNKTASAYKAIGAMICITVIEVAAIFNGMDGVLLSLAVAALAGLGGYAIRDRILKR